MNRRCLNCMKLFDIPKGYEAEDNCCPFCGFVENTPNDVNSYLPVGTILNNRYTVGTVIGAGGFGITYKAWDSTLESTVAIKEYYPQGVVSRVETTIVSVYDTQSESFQHGKSRFLKEARNLARFNNNPRTASIQDFFEENQTAYIVMEYLDGCNLKKYMEEHSEALPYDTVLNMADNICDVLSDVHSIGLIHRDISPDNIFMCKDGTFKLIDFGAVKQSVADDNLSATVILKHGYAPIEQYSKSGNVGPWTDIYALSATIYKLLSRKTPQESVDRLTDDNLVPIKTLNNDVSMSFNNAIMRGMAIQPKDRYQNIRSFKRDLFSNVDAFTENLYGYTQDTYHTGISNTAGGYAPYNNTQGNYTGGGSGGASNSSKKGSSKQIKGAAGIVLIPLLTIVLVLGAFFWVTNRDDDDDEKVREQETTTEAATEPEEDGKTEVSLDTSTEYKISEIRVNTNEDDWSNNLAIIPSGSTTVHFYWQLESAPDKIQYRVKGRYPGGGTYDNLIETRRDVNSMQGFSLYQKDETGNITGMSPGLATIEVYNDDTGELLGNLSVTVQ